MEDPKEEKTLVLIKPDGVKRGLIGEIISRFEKRGLKVISLEMFMATRDQIDEHYPKDEKWTRRLGEKTLNNYREHNIDPKEELGSDDPLEIGKMVRGWLLDYMTSGPMVKIMIKGIHAVSVVRKIVGKSLPTEAEVGTIRGDFSIDSPAAANHDKRSVYNIVHASETQEEAAHELAFWFAAEDVFDYKRADEFI